MMGNNQNLFFSPEEKGRAFSDVLKEVQEYISSKYSTLMVEGGNDEVKQQVKRYISKYIADYRITVKGKTREELINEGYIDVAVMVLCVMLVIALGVRLFPIFITKMQVDNFADELAREAEISGRVGSETSNRQRVLEERTGIHPTVQWSRTGNLQLNEEVTVTVTIQKDLGLFGNFGSFPITIRARASGKSEVYWK